MLTRALIALTAVLPLVAVDAQTRVTAPDSSEAPGFWHHAYADLFVSAVAAGDLWYMTEGDALGNVSTSSNDPTSVSPGNGTGFVSVGSFFGVAGTSAADVCKSGTCTGTQGFASGGIHDADGSNDAQMGSSIVRPEPLSLATNPPTVTPSPFVAIVTPEPATITLMASGLIGLAGFARRRRTRADAEVV